MHCACQHRAVQCTVYCKGCVPLIPHIALQLLESIHPARVSYVPFLEHLSRFVGRRLGAREPFCFGKLSLKRHGPQEGSRAEVARDFLTTRTATRTTRSARATTTITVTTTPPPPPRPPPPPPPLLLLMLVLLPPLLPLLLLLLNLLYCCYENVNTTAAVAATTISTNTTTIHYRCFFCCFFVLFRFAYTALTWCS